MQQIGDLRLVRIADHITNAWQGGNLSRSALRVTSSDDDASEGICGMDFADGVACLSIGRGRDSTSINYDNVRSLCIFFRDTALIAQLPFDGCAIRIARYGRWTWAASKANSLLIIEDSGEGARASFKAVRTRV